MNDSILSGKTARILQIYEKLNLGETLHKKELAEHFGISEKSIQRDLEDLREYLENSDLKKDAPKILYSAGRGYFLSRKNVPQLDPKDIFAVLKILLETRAFPKEEMNRLLDSLILAGKDPKIQEMIRNEQCYYVEPLHRQNLINLIWKIELSITKSRLVEISYRRQDSKVKDHTIKPVGILFNEHYFYLHAQICESQKPHPAIFRIDRLKKYHVTNKEFLPQRFEEGIYRQYIQYMYQGQMMHIKFKFWGDSLEAVRDRLPTAKVVDNDGKKRIVEADAYDNGIVMWLLSQREFLEVLEPHSLREEIKGTLKNMLKNYSKDET